MTDARRTTSLISVSLLSLCLLVSGPFLANPPGEKGALGDRLDQADIVAMSVAKASAEGIRVFTTPMNKLDGYGDGPIDLNDTTSPGGRPTLQGNGSLLRINGLDAQACFECHTLVSNATIPATLGLGGSGGTNSNAMFQTTVMDPSDLDLDETAAFNGRFINPPFVFGVGGVELAGLEMTEDLQALKQQAIDNPGTLVSLSTKGVNFGTIVADGLGGVDTSQVAGISSDLVVRPFGRKGEFGSTREFDVGAMQFHLGMQPVEAVGQGVDADGDGVVDEVTVGEISALSVFLSGGLARPEQLRLDDSAEVGQDLFSTLGCAGCHVPSLNTRSTNLPLRFPEVAGDPYQNVYKMIDLTRQPMRFSPNANGGVTVPLYADLKRHDMGPELAEDFALVNAQTNREFTTAKLWGVADSGPWLHDGRALTLTDAILAHGGEAQVARDGFDVLLDTERTAVLAFLRTLRTPQPNNGRNIPRRPRVEGAGTGDQNQSISRR